MSFFEDRDPEASKRAILAMDGLPSINRAPGPGLFDGTWTALKSAPGAAGREVLRALSPVLDAYGKAAAFRDAPEQTMMRGLPTPDMQQVKRETIDRMGENDMRRTLTRSLERDYTLDPQSTGTAAQIVHGVTKTLGKAVGYGAIGGLPAAAAGLAIDEGANETMRLQDQGVDTETAAKAGAIHGLASGGSVFIPGFGTTALKTAGLVAASGPGLFMAEQAAINHILESENYDEIAEQYDPLDPVGLTVSTLMAAAGGAAGMASRSRIRAMDAETVAAARITQMERAIEQSALTRQDDPVGMQQHAQALQNARQAIDEGEAVSVPAEVVDIATAREAAARVPVAELRSAMDEAEPMVANSDIVIPTSRAEAELASVSAREAETGNPVSLDAQGLVKEDPEVQQARQLIAENDIAIRTGEAEDGSPAYQSARQMLDDADATLELAQQESSALRAAVTCFLKHGD